MNLHTILETAKDQSRTRAPNQWQPQLFVLPEQSSQLESLLASGDVTIIDSIESQLHNLLQIRSPGQKLTSETLHERAKTHIGETPLWQYGTWVYFPVETLRRSSFAGIGIS
ncbi:MAG: hypothetical protein KDB27_07240 [Planctomycetales bacterium]|nr:hypothetical protein [Planctomycetales bacterium]